MGVNKASIEEFWQAFLKESGRDTALRYNDCYHFCSNEKAANGLLALVLEGKKRATTSLLRCYEVEGDPPPAIGDLCVLTDWESNPRCVVETTAVTIMPFREMTFDICSREGEDENLDSWRRNHIHCFTMECEEIGTTFSEDMKVVFEDFRIVYRQ